MNGSNDHTNGVKRFFNKIKDKLKRLVSLDEEGAETEGKFVHNLFIVKVVPASNDMSLIYDAPSMYSSNKLVRINNEKPKEVEERRFSIRTDSSPSNKRKTNSIIKIVSYIVDAKFNKSYDNGHHTKSAFKPINRSQPFISLQPKSIINCNDFDSASQRDVLKPIPIKVKVLNSKRERDSAFPLNESYVKLSSEKKRRFDDNESMKSQKEDVSMKSMFSSKRKHDMRSVSMKSIADSKIDVKSLGMGSNVKNLEEVKKEIEDKKRANSRMFDEISRKSSQLNEINQKRLEYLDRRRVVADYYKDKLKNKKEIEIFNLEPLPMEKVVDNTLKDRNLLLAKQENLNILQKQSKNQLWESNKLSVEQNTFTVSPKTVEKKILITPPQVDEKKPNLFLPTPTKILPPEENVSLVTSSVQDELRSETNNLTQKKENKTEEVSSLFKKPEETIKPPSFGLFNKQTDQPMFKAATNFGLFSTKQTEQVTQEKETKDEDTKQENKDVNAPEKLKEVTKPNFTWGNESIKPITTPSALFGATKPENQPTPDKTSTETSETTKSIFGQSKDTSLAEEKPVESTKTLGLFNGYTKTIATTSATEDSKEETKSVQGLFGTKDNTATAPTTKLFGAPSQGLFAKKETEQSKEETKSELISPIVKTQPPTTIMFGAATVQSTENKTSLTPPSSQQSKTEQSFIKPPAQESSSSLVNSNNPFINPGLNPQKAQTMFAPNNTEIQITQNNPPALNPFSINNSNRGTNDIFGGPKPSLFDTSSNSKPSILGINKATTTSNIFMPKEVTQNETDMSICSPVLAPKLDPNINKSNATFGSSSNLTYNFLGITPTANIFASNSSTQGNIFGSKTGNLFGQGTSGSLFPSTNAPLNQTSSNPHIGIFGTNSNTNPIGSTIPMNTPSLTFPQSNPPTGSLFSSNFASNATFSAPGTGGNLFSLGKKK